MLKIQLLCCGNKMPQWVNTATDEFQKRLQEFVHFSIIEIPLQKRSKGAQLSKIIEKESQALLNHIPPQSHVILLDSQGKTFDSLQLAKKVESLQLHNSHWTIIIGGPEGPGPLIHQRANEKWSLSHLTFAHPIARIICIEALYRSFAILHNHPYHK